MNRVIKFRAFHKTWRNEEGRGMQGVKGLWWGNSGVGHIHLSEWADSTLLSDVELMQFTGLLDKNGKEIYEGDVLKWKGARYWKERNPDAGKVVWAHEGYPSFSVINDYDNSSYSLLLGGKNPQETFEIIGNVYESPDLLTNNRSMP